MTNKTSPKYIVIILSIALGVFVLVSGIGGVYITSLISKNTKLESKIENTAKGQNLDSFIDKNSPQGTKTAYLFARENIAVLKEIKCYCGCQSTNYGHTSLANCFVEKISDNSVIVYSDHAKNCQLCVNEAISVKKWLKEGKNYKEISNLVTEKYAPKNQ